MLTAVLDRLTSLTSKAFIIGAFVPVLAFAFLNGVVLYLGFGWFRAWAEPQISVAARAFDLVAVLVGLAVVAYVLSSLSAFLQQVLEGQHLWHGSWLADRLRRAQLRSYQELRAQYREARDAVVRTTKAKSVWTKRLLEAAERGSQEHRGHNAYDGLAGPAPAALARLRRHQRKAKPLAITDLEEAVVQLSAALAGNDVTTGPTALSQHRLDLLMLFDYAEDEWAERELALANRLRARFGTGAVAATAFGNVGRSMQSYAFSRYRLDLTTFWSRLQPLVQKHQEFYGGLQDAKVQLDFLVLCAFLSAFSTAVWLVVLPIWAGAWWLLLAVAVLGVVLTRLFYLAATENYVAFGELVRSSIDLYRFDLVDALRMPRPGSLRDERLLWDTLRRVSAAGQEEIDLSYRQPDQAKEPQP